MRKESFDFDKALKDRKVRGLRNVASLLMGYADRVEQTSFIKDADLISNYFDFIRDTEGKAYDKEKFSKIVDLTFYF